MKLQVFYVLSDLAIVLCNGQNAVWFARNGSWAWAVLFGAIACMFWPIFWRDYDRLKGGE